MKRFKAIIVGSGFGGIGAAIKLRNQGIEDLIILEKSNHPGGTWYHNSYPGAAVDVKSYLYCFSFEPYDWTRIFAEQQEILDYTNHVIDKYGLRPIIETGKKVQSAIWDENEKCWNLNTSDGEAFQCKYLVNSTGGLHTPSIPALPGADLFEGTQFHSAQWNHDYDYKGKRVAVIGTGASAVQVVPAIADDCKELFVMQRTPHWTLTRPDRKLKNWERKLLTKHKWIRKLYRSSIYWTNESRILAFANFPSILKIFKLVSMANLKKQVRDPELRKKLIPEYTIGCKRVLVTSEYYPALQKNNVELVTDGIDKIESDGIALDSGRQLKVDLIVYCTGFKAADFFPYPLQGRDNLSIEESWKNGAHAFKGTVIPGFPNFFMLAGPNTGIGHNSALDMLECQIDYTARAINYLEKNNHSSLEVNAQIESKYNDWVQGKLKNTVWLKGGCNSWYLNQEGKNTTLYPTFNSHFRRACRNFKPENFHVD